MLRIREDAVLTASQSIADAFAGFHLGDHNEQDGANLQRKIAIIKVTTNPVDGTTLVVGSKTYTFKATATASTHIKIGNLVTNGDFAGGDASWINYGHWATNSSGWARHTAGSGYTQTLEQEWFPTPVSGYSYVTGFTVANRTSGYVRIGIGDALGTARSGNSGYTETIVASGVGPLKFVPSADFDGDISAVTVTNTNTDLKGLTAKAIADKVNADRASTGCTAYNSLGQTYFVALLANAVGATPTLTVDSTYITSDTAWTLTVAEAKLESTDYFKRNIVTEGEVKPTVLVERNSGTPYNFLY